MKNISVGLLLLNIALLSIIDCLYTISAVSYGLGEVNPIMDAIIQTPLFPLIKLFIIPIALLWLWTIRDKWQHNGLINLGLWTLFVFYGALTVWHIMVQVRLG